jgi:hypothetical protein
MATVTNLIVVEAFNPCTCHVAVTARRQDRPFFIFFNVKSPIDINFGDTILVDGPCEMDSVIESAYLYRGPELFYHLILDTFDSRLLDKLLTERTELILDIHGEEDN